MNTPNQVDVRAVALKILIGLPLAGFLWTIIFRILGSSEIWNWNIMIIFASLGAVIGGGSWAYYPFGASVSRFWNKLISLIDLVIVWFCLPLFYYKILTPLSFLIRILGKSNFSHRKQNTGSYWNDVAKPKNTRRYLQQF